MYNTQYSTWDFYPRYLSPNEINNPMEFISEFFSSEWLPDHLDALKEWRASVLEDRYYKGGKDNPADLLFIYKLNIHLIEAAYLLMQINKNCEPDERPEDEQDEQLESEKESWQVYPNYLSRDELLDPYKVIEAFFNSYSLPEYRKQLDEWLESGLSIHGVAEFLSAEEIITVYENLQKLYEATWVLLQRDEQRQEVNTDPTEKTPQAAATGLQAAIDLIIAAVQPEKIFLLKHTADESHIEKEHHSIVIVLPDKNHTVFKEIEPVIELAFLQYPTIYATLIKSCLLQEYITNGHIFYSFVCTSDNMTYTNNEVDLPTTTPDKLEKLIQIARSTFEQSFKKAVDFKALADHHRDQSDNGFIAFLLQQATELTFRAAIQSLFEPDFRSHSLRVLKKHNQNVLPILNDLFPDTDEVESRLVKLLDDAYTYGRYSPDFKVHNRDLQIFFERVTAVHQCALTAFEKRIEQLRLD